MGGEEEMLVANLGKIMDKATLSSVAARATRTMPAREGGDEDGATDANAPEVSTPTTLATPASSAMTVAGNNRDKLERTPLKEVADWKLLLAWLSPNGIRVDLPMVAQRTLTGPGPQNYGWENKNYNYILTPNELIHYDRNHLQWQIGKGSFGQVVKAIDTQTKQEIAFKIIKSKKLYLMQVKTEIAHLTCINENDEGDELNIV